MKVFYSPYILKPLKRANRLSSLDPKPGVLLKGVLGDKTTFADYFPHPPLGDRSCDQFLSEFKFQEDEYDQKVFDLLLRDASFQNIKPKKFFNHQLWSGCEHIEAKIIKYKLLHSSDRNFISSLERGISLRLDANALFTRDEFYSFLKDIPEKYIPLIEYIEDPISEKDWSGLKIPTARDFIGGDHFSYYIYKPNCEFYPKTSAKVIFSSYLGGNLGRFHAYCDLVENGDLGLTHGIITEGFFQEEINFMKGNFNVGFIPDNESVRKIYQDASNLNWKLLCTI
jgi:hypothetical protein